MKGIINKLIAILIVILTIITILFTNNVYASFAEYDDETADKQANEDLKEQEAKDAENAGKSSNNYLKQLSIKGYELTPKFDKQIINYTIEEELSDGEVEISAVSDDDRATVIGLGKVILQSGENNLKIDVKAENGMQRTYFIKVNKKIADKRLKLTSLNLKAIDDEGNSHDIELNQDFNSEVFTYNCNVYNNVKKIQLDAESEESDTQIKIEGNENLKEGKNTILITLKNKNSEDEVIYKIEVNKAYSIEESVKVKNNAVSIVLICALLLTITAIIGIKKKKSRKKSKH